MAGVETGPLTLSEILDRMFSIYRKNFLMLVGIAGLPYAGVTVVIGFLVGIAALISAGGTPDAARIGVGAVGAVFLVVIIVMVFIFIVAVILASLGTYAAVWDIQVGRTTGIKRAYGVAWSHVGAAILAGILAGLAMIAGFVLLIIPGIIVYLALSLIYPVIIAEDSGGAESLGRSWELTKGYRWKIFVAVLVSFAVSTAITYGIQIPMAVIGSVSFAAGNMPVWFVILNALASVVGSVVPAPLLAIASCLIYYDPRVRKEGFDLQRMLDQLPPPVPGEASGAPEIAVG
jgi:Membrane domain of glycerophosphoryl diester phosphodiesterase